MKHRILIPVCILSAALLAGCSKEENIPEQNIPAATFQAVTESGGTKTFLENGDSETESHPVLWTPGDAIGITSASAFGRYEYNGTENTAVADFDGDPIEGDSFYAVYPYSGEASLSGGVLSLELPSVQEYTPLSFAPASFPMVARSESTYLEFKNLCGLLKLNLTGTATVRSVVFRSSGRGVSGQATVDMNYESVPELVMSGDAGTSVTLDCGEGVALSGTVPVPFYIVLPAGTYDDFSIEVITADGKVMTKSNSGLVINRSMVRPTSDVEFVPDEVLGDREALIAFYNATDGPNWTDNTNWCSDEPLDTWYGVTTDSEGRVTRISLANNGLSGDAGNTLAPLTELTYLSCENNNLSELNLSNNTALEKLYCPNNSLSELDLSYNTALRYLDCHGNRLTVLDVRNNVNLGESVKVGRQTDVDGNYVYMYLYVTEAQLEQWNNSWRGLINNEYVEVSTQENYFTISPQSFEVPAAGGAITVNISTDQNYTVDITNPEWISLVSGEGLKVGQLVFKVAKNTDAAERTGMIQFCAGLNCYVVEVRQEAGSQGGEEWPFNKTFYHRSLGMRFTADWCGYCPNMSAAFSTVQEQLPDKFEVVNYHDASSGLGFSPTSTLMSQYGITGFPSGIVDGRMEVANYDQSVIVSKVISAISETESTYPTVSGISFISSISGQTLTADVTLYLKEAADYKVTVVVLEDGIVGYQANYYGETYYDYVHDGVARIALSDISGDAFTTTEDNVTRTFSYSAEIPADYIKYNLRILVYVQRAFGSQPVISSGDYGGYYVDNCVSAKAGTSLDLVTVEDMEDIGGGNEDFGNDDRHEW